MRKIATLTDHVLGKPYHLYQVNARDIVTRIRSNYDIPLELLHMFNSDSEIAENVFRIKNAEVKGRGKDEYAEERLQKAVERVEKKEYVDEMGTIGIHFGFELMPLVVSAHGDVENIDTPLELIDGFKRTFCLEETPSVDILVKVYEPLSDTDWINAMILYNSWKFEDSKGSRKYMDRGFQLGMYYRYRIVLTDFLVKGQEYFNLFDIYAGGGALSPLYIKHTKAIHTYQTYWNNGCFFKDIQLVRDIFNLSPSFTIQKAKRTVMLTPSDTDYRERALERVLKLFIETLGKIRRYEYETNVTERRPFDLKDIEEFLADEQYQATFFKVMQMSVDGHIVKNIETDIRPALEERMFASMGYRFK